MQQVAAEMNLSETAFLVQREEGYELRWFTPEAEVDLCGHATLASAHMLWETGRLERGTAAKFFTKSGWLYAEQLGQSGEPERIVENGQPGETGLSGWVKLDFPSLPPQPVRTPEELIQGLGLIPRYVGRNEMDYVAEIDSEETLRALKPDWSLISRLDARGLIVTSRSSSAEYDFVSRAFYPATGVNEDPVTGSAHCALAPYWAKKLRQDKMTGYQASQRGGVVKVELAGERVYLLGQAVTVVEGQLRAGLGR